MKISRLYLLPAVAIFATMSCTRDNTTIDPPGPESQAETRVSLNLRMPANYSTQTATVDENMVKNAYVLAFKSVDGTTDGEEVYDYSSLAYSITDGDESRYKTIKATLLKREYPQKLVLVTNAKLAVEALNLQQGVKTKDEVLELLEFSNAIAWHSEMDTFTPIPMWGESDKVTIDDNTQTIGTVILTRMVSRIDVVKADAITDKHFTLTSVHLYNHLKNGRVAPHRASTHWDDTAWKALHPTMPSTDNNKIKGPIEVKAASKGSSTYIPTVYAFETEAAANGAWDEATCVVIGGKYDGATKDSYYRVDFVEREDGTVTGYKHLLRNHIYRINITDVYGSGHPDPDEAFESQSVNIEADVKNWDEGSITDVVFDKDHMLGVSQTEFRLPRNESKDNLLIVTTDVPSGWTIDDTATATWLKFRTTGFSGENAKDEVFLELEENDTGAERSTTFTVRAGRLSIVITVKQGINEKYSLELLDEGKQPVDNLLFTSYADQLTFSSRTVSAKWEPTLEACMVSYFVTGTYGLGFNSRLNPFTETSLSGGEKQYTVYPDDVTPAELISEPFIEKSARVNLVVGEGSDALVKTLRLRQVHYNLFTDEEESYPLDGSPQYFTLKTNADWTVTSITGNSKLATISKTSGGPVPAGENFTFTMANDPEGKVEDRSMTITFTYTGEDGRSATKKVVINADPARGLKDAGDANSYILQPDGDGVAIPLSWANNTEYGTLIGANDAVTVRIIWMDSNRGLADNSVISSYKLTGTGADRMIEVYPGSQEGNALIGAYVGDEIRWSWHIWVTNYDIEGTAFSSPNQTWMNINLGATSVTINNKANYGTLYQWGRKDPFPPGMTQVWNEQKQTVNITKTANSSANSIRTSISAPTTFYYGSDWLGSSSGSSAVLWLSSGNQKTTYDPCPGGWRMPFYTTGYDGPFTDLGWTRPWNTQGISITVGGQARFFPAAGRVNASGNFENGNTNGYYWTALPNSSSQLEGVHMSFNSATSNYYHGANRGFGMSVRCVKE